MFDLHLVVPILSVNRELQGRQVARPQTVLRKSSSRNYVQQEMKTPSRLAFWKKLIGGTPRGYVALAVATTSGEYKKELSTGLGGDREANMVQFAVEALTLLRDVIKGDAKL